MSPHDLVATHKARPCRVLFVEDDESTRDAFAQYLGDAGLTVHVAARGREAILVAREARPNVVVLDLWLPDVDGYSVIEVLRSDPDTAAVPVIVLTGAIPEWERLRGRAAAIVMKPCAPRELLSLIRLTAEATA